MRTPCSACWRDPYAEAMRYVVYGAGAVGGAIGGRLHLAGLDVTLIARGEHLRALQKDGLRLDTAAGLQQLRVPAVGSVAEVAWTEDTVVLLTLKAQHTASAVDDLAAHAPGQTPLVSVQNGVANEPVILRRFPRTYAVHVILPATHLTPGVVVEGSAGRPGALDIGLFPTGVDEVAEAVAADLRAAGFESVPRADIMAWKHRKLLNNLANGVDAVAAPGPAAEELISLARAEGERVLAGAGRAVVTDAQDAQRRDGVLEPRGGVPRGSSTRQSLQRGASVEIDYLNGEIVLLGRLHGVPTPVNELICRTVHDLARSGGPAGSLDAAVLLGRLAS